MQNYILFFYLSKLITQTTEIVIRTAYFIHVNRRIMEAMPTMNISQRYR